MYISAEYYLLENLFYLYKHWYEVLINMKTVYNIECIFNKNLLFFR